jgi:hypothetical protein
MRERNWESSRRAGLYGGDFRRSGDSARCHPAHREIALERDWRREFQQALDWNENENQRSLLSSRRRQSSYHKIVFRTAPFRQSTHDPRFSAKSQKPSVDLRHCSFPASSFRPWPCRPFSCRQTASFGVRSAPNGNPRSSKGRRTRGRTQRPTKTPTAATPRSNLRESVWSTCQFRSYDKADHRRNLGKCGVFRSDIRRERFQKNGFT